MSWFVIFNKKILLVLVCFSVVIGSYFFVYNLGKQVSVLPREYKEYEILAQMSIDKYVNGAQLIVVNAHKKNGIPVASLYESKIIFVQNDKVFELSGGGGGLEWWYVGDINGNGMFDIAVMYDGMGSISAGAFYIYEWNGAGFDVLLHNQDMDNRNELIDIDGDWIKEIVHTYRKEEHGENVRDVYKWVDGAYHLSEEGCLVCFVLDLFE